MPRGRELAGSDLTAQGGRLRRASSRTAGRHRRTNWLAWTSPSIAPDHRARGCSRDPDGAQDRLTNVLAVMLGVTVGAGRSDLVALAGISAAVAEAVSMVVDAGREEPRPTSPRRTRRTRARTQPERIGIHHRRGRPDRRSRPTGPIRRAPASRGSRGLRRDLAHRTVRARVVDRPDQRCCVVARWPLPSSRCLRCSRRSVGSRGDAKGRLRARAVRRFGPTNS